uniref:hypothetical protein n=1 Tax=Psychrobacter sp. TaxID=56811 RepID=UPI0015EEFA99|nr:hypothetical protein [Psychrobacter sp.]
MNFNSMGSMDAEHEVQKTGVDVSKGETKTATIRTSGAFLELLIHVSEKMGMSRQAFMSKLIEQKATEAVAEYLSGYASYMNIEDIDASMFADVPDTVDPKLLKDFTNQVENNLLRMRLDAEAFNALDYNHPAKYKYTKKLQHDAANKLLDGAFDKTPLPKRPLTAEETKAVSIINDIEGN